MTYAGFFVHLNDIPPVLRWLQWLCPLKYTLEALSVNEVGSGLMIQDSLQGVPVNVSASLIMNLVCILHTLFRWFSSQLTVLFVSFFLALRFRLEQLLSRCPRSICIYRGFRSRGYWYRLAQGSGEAMSDFHGSFSLLSVWIFVDCILSFVPYPFTHTLCYVS